MAKALLLVDIQNDYFPGGAMELVGSVEAGNQARQLLAAFRRKSLPVIHVQHIALHPGATFFLPNTGGVETHGCVSPERNEIVVQKHFPNSFRDTPLLERLREFKVAELVIAGMMTHMCIDATTRAAFDFGFECLIPSDACATKDLTLDGKSVPADAVHHAFLAALNGTYGRVTTAAEVVAAV